MLKPLRSGYTTGACAAAAAKGAALLLRDGTVPDAVITSHRRQCLLYPAQQLSRRRYLHLPVIKDAGDDGHHQPRRGKGRDRQRRGERDCHRRRLRHRPGDRRWRCRREWAINPVPRHMIGQAVREVLPVGSYRVTISIPDGEERRTK